MSLFTGVFLYTPTRDTKTPVVPGAPNRKTLFSEPKDASSDSDGSSDVKNEVFRTPPRPKRMTLMRCVQPMAQVERRARVIRVLVPGARLPNRSSPRVDLSRLFNEIKD